MRRRSRRHNSLLLPSRRQRHLLDLHSSVRRKRILEPSSLDRGRSSSSRCLRKLSSSRIRDEERLVTNSRREARLHREKTHQSSIQVVTKVLPPNLYRAAKLRRLSTVNHDHSRPKTITRSIQARRSIKMSQIVAYHNSRMHRPRKSKSIRIRILVD